MAIMKFSEIESLFEQEKYQLCLDEIEKLMDQMNSELAYQVLKGKCLAKLDRVSEINILWSSIDFEEPNMVDVEAMKLIVLLLEYQGDIIQAKRFSRILAFVTKNINYLEEEKTGFLSNFVWHKEMWDYYWGMSEFYFSCSDFVLAEIFYSMYLLDRKEGISNVTNYGNALLNHRNIGDIRRILIEKEDTTIVIVLDNSENYQRYMNLAKILKKNKREVIFITLPVEMEIEEEIQDITPYIELSLENMEYVDGISTYVPLQFINNGSYYDDTKLALIDYFSKQTKDELLFVLGERIEFSRLRSRYASRKNLHYICKNTKIKNAFTEACFGYYGSYESYLSIFYGLNLRDKLMEESEYDVSIVLPVRNNSSTLEYTLATCLNQKCKNYEVVVCDNSDSDNDMIYQLIKEKFDDPRINYVRTPRVFPITKSFEYAYLQAKGEFVIPIGADDGILLGALNKLLETRDVIKKETGEDPNILMWDRISYIWDDFEASGKAGELVIPRIYYKDQVEYEKIDCKRQLEDILLMPGLMYGLPLLYLNSGFKRAYLLEMLDRTGAILDGHSQDIYTGIANLLLNDHYYYIKYPITMAAISSQSSGAGSISGSVSTSLAIERGKEDLLTNVMMPIQRDIEDIIHPSDGDVANMICQLLRMMDMECIPFSFLKKIPWFVIGCNIANQIQYKDVNGTKIKRQLINSIAIFSKEDANRVKVGLEQGLIELKHYEEIDGKKYFKGYKGNGSLVLDASEFAVHDVYEACMLFNKITNIF
jgi:hypothetical protein